jgi:putative GTP pyrophosphokinase
MGNRVELAYSRNRVKQAGKALRGHYAHAAQLDTNQLREAVAILDHWRACHSYPLQKATMGLRSRVGTARCQDPRVSQRLKRRPTIIDKLLREPVMQLTTMQDIGGCRGVLASTAEVRAVQRLWTKTSHRVDRVYDYMTHPKPSGYRGVHLVVHYDGFPVEVQLRTRLQHAWGIGIERVGPRIGADLKGGEGPAEILHLFRVFGDLLAGSEGLPTVGYDWDDFREAVRTVEPAVLALVGLQVSDESVRLVLPT